MILDSIDAYLAAKARRVMFVGIMLNKVEIRTQLTLAT